MPPAGQPQRQKNYGRQIPEIQPEEILTETIQGQQRRPKEKIGRRRQVRHQEKVTVRCLLFLLKIIPGETDFLAKISRR